MAPPSCCGRRPSSCDGCCNFWNRAPYGWSRRHEHTRRGRAQGLPLRSSCSTGRGQPAMMCHEAAGGDGEALHSLLLYDSEESLRGRAVPFLRAGLDRGETVIAVVSADVRGAALRPARSATMRRGCRGRPATSPTGASGRCSKGSPVPRRTARRRVALRLLAPERPHRHPSPDGRLPAQRGHGQRGPRRLRLPLGLPLRHPQQLHPDAAGRCRPTHPRLLDDSGRGCPTATTWTRTPIWGRPRRPTRGHPAQCGSTSR